MVREKRPARGAEHCTRREQLSALSRGAGSQSGVSSLGRSRSGSEIDELDFFGVDGALEKAGADADEVLDGIGGEDRARGLRSLQAFAACKAARVRTTTINRSADDVPSLVACRASQLESVGQAREAVCGL